MLIKLNRFVNIYHKNHYNCPPHTHSHNEYVYCLQGGGQIEVDGKEQDFEKGTIYIVPAGESHAEYGKNGTEIIFFHFECESFKFPTGIFNDNDGSLLNILRQLQAEHHSEDASSEIMKTALLIQLLIMTERSKTEHVEQKKLAPILEYIDKNFQFEINIFELAKKLNYSYEHFRHIFKEHVGISPWNYVIEKRIEMAKHLIKTTDMSLSEIGYGCGFSSSSHFSMTFRSKTGYTPTEYKKRHS